MALETRFLTLTVSFALVLSAFCYAGIIPLAFAQSTAQTYHPSIMLDPKQGPPGTVYAVDGIGYPPGRMIKVSDPWDDKYVYSDKSGSFYVKMQVPSNAQPGTYWVNAETTALARSIATSLVDDEAQFTVTGKAASSSTPVETAKGTVPPNPSPPQNEKQAGAGQSSAAGTSRGSYTYKESNLKVDPASGPPGTKFYVTCLDFSPSIAVRIDFQENDYPTTTDPSGTCVVGIVADPNSEPGTYSVMAQAITNTHSEEYNDMASADFTVTGKKTVPTPNPVPTATGTGTTNPPPPPPNGTRTGEGATGGTTSTSGAASGSPPTPPPPPPPQPPGTGSEGEGTGSGEGGTGSEDTGTGNEGGTYPGNHSGPIAPMPPEQPVTKRDPPHSQESGATFAVEKEVINGDAKAAEFEFTVKLTGKQGNAQYDLHLVKDSGDYATFEFNLDLPQGTALDTGSYQIIETDPGEYTATYSNGCSGSYGNDGYMYWCDVSNTIVTPPTPTTPVATGPTEPQPQPGATVPSTTQTAIPAWVKNSAKWWTQGRTSDGEFVQSLQYLANSGTISLPTSQSSANTPATTSTGSQQIPSWVKKTVQWWESGQVSDDEFKSAVKYMLSTKVITAAR